MTSPHWFIYFFKSVVFLLLFFKSYFYLSFNFFFFLVLIISLSHFENQIDFFLSFHFIFSFFYLYFGFNFFFPKLFFFYFRHFQIYATRINFLNPFAYFLTSFYFDILVSFTLSPPSRLPFLNYNFLKLLCNFFIFSILTFSRLRSNLLRFDITQSGSPHLRNFITHFIIDLSQELTLLLLVQSI
jgi:hypothetical protein